MGGGGLCTCSRLSLQPCSQRSPGVGSWDSGTEPTFTTRGPASLAPVQAALVHVRRLPLGVGEGSRKVCHVLAGARGHL